MGILDGFKKGVQNFTDSAKETISENTQQVVEIAPQFDPTDPNSEYGDEVGIAGDVVLNVVTEGGAGTAFSDGTEGIGQWNEATDNTLTINNIEEQFNNDV